MSLTCPCLYGWMDGSLDRGRWCNGEVMLTIACVLVLALAEVVMEEDVGTTRVEGVAMVVDAATMRDVVGIVAAGMTDLEI